MDKIWEEMYNAAKAVLKPVTISDYVTAGEVSAAVLSKSGKIYTGVCIDTCSTLGVCAERNAIFNMITNGESGILLISLGGNLLSNLSLISCIKPLICSPKIIVSSPLSEKPDTAVAAVQQYPIYSHYCYL